MRHKKEDRSPAGKAALPKKHYNRFKNIGINFQAINTAAVAVLPRILERWLPQGKLCGHEWVALNPHRVDRHTGSFKVNIHTGRWADFATGDRGGDPISLVAFLDGIGQADAARRLAIMLYGVA